jgi:lysophospholipase L1-like esterase
MRTGGPPQLDSSVKRRETVKSGRSGFIRTARTYLVIIGITTIVTLGLAELVLRAAYWEGMSFSDGGPFAARFERDFQFNRYDGPSRGPELTGAKGDDSLRILIQGDSITWGKGIKNESALYSSLLRERLRSIDPDVEVAVLAKPGREIDGHLTQLRKWGESIAPDIIIYQWYINDLELDKSHRPDYGRWWRRFIFPGFITQHSYLWYLLNHRIGMSIETIPYQDYMRAHFNTDTRNWGLFVEQFHAWAVEAKRLTPNVLIALYPYLLSPPEVPLLEFNASMEELSRKEGIAVIDLMNSLDAFRDDLTRIYASPFDAHPNPAAHELIADALADRLLELWPDVLRPSLPGGQTDDRGHASGDVAP